MTQKRTFCAPDGPGIAAIGPRLLATDIHLGGAVNQVCWRAITGFGRDRFDRSAVLDGLGIGHQTFPSALAAKAALAYAAKAGCSVKKVGGIYPDHARGQLWRDIKGEVHILGPDGRRQPIAGIVGDAHRFRRRSEGCRHENRPKNLFLHQRVSRSQIAD